MRACGAVPSGQITMASRRFGAAVTRDKLAVAVTNQRAAVGRCLQRLRGDGGKIALRADSGTH
ncbi:hypothetical protein ALP90_101614 [Pseudomonas amygdali pv. ulmi]|uniref:Uncharacterized protein n=1 Tax=Pseudomonas amygdali pv. ulmi TaxID=251720 RepID=A0A3M4T6E6_PSEA0|nr:hypothetical protein ALP90_101614 [Pseudomonas amygdali pv. ulmi]